ncbi:DUF4097 family beta strand repeat-containing protein [Lentilactobacillus hilgardii]|uniref:DUF4097 family beta strand repeat-containing protein n=1 Tax=Lentilactobacillus hilgardii TaxID=1588 RepID=UPI00390CBECD
MKKPVIIGLVTMIVGLILAVVALGHSGLQTVYWDSGFKVESQRNNSKTYQKTFGANVKQIEFTADNAIEIRSGDVSKTQVSYTTGTKVQKNGDILTVDSPNRHHIWRVGFNIDSEDDDQGRTIITLPRKVKLTRISGRNNDELFVRDLSLKDFQLSGQADLDMQDVKIASDLNLKGSGGDSTLTRVSAPSVSQDTLGGDIDYQNCRFVDNHSYLSSAGGDISISNNQFKDVSINVQGGDFSFRNNRILKRLSAKSAGGDIDGQVLNRQQSRVAVSAEGGDVELFGQSNHSWNMDKKKAVSYHLSSEGGDVTIE